MDRVRRPSVAGQFYPAEPEKLRRELVGCYLHPLGPGKVPEAAANPLRGIAGFVVPHAAHAYSGPIAAHAFHCVGSLGRPEVAVLLGPNHYAAGQPLALSPWGWWDTPLGRLPVETALAERLAAMVPGLLPDPDAHRREHSLEVQLPFLLHLYGPSLPILPILMTNQSLAAARRLGEALASLLAGKSALLPASSDFSHYLSDRATRREDAHALRAIQELDEHGLARVVEERGLTMCGPGPVMALIAGCRALGATAARLLAYGTSGDTSGYRSRVVGYAALKIAWVTRRHGAVLE